MPPFQVAFIGDQGTAMKVAFDSADQRRGELSIPRLVQCLTGANREGYYNRGEAPRVGERPHAPGHMSYPTMALPFPVAVEADRVPHKMRGGTLAADSAPASLTRNAALTVPGGSFLRQSFPVKEVLP